MLESCEHEEIPVIALCGRILGRGQQRIVGHRPVRRNPDLRFAWVIDAGRHDADDRVRLVVEALTLSDRVRPAAEALPPERVADHGRSRCPVHFILGCERAAERRRDLENVEEVGVDDRRAAALRVIARGQRHAGFSKAGQPREAVIAGAPIEEVRRRGVAGRLTGLPVRAADQHQLASARIR
jgi:hypothetical protein